jgi:hypothetical protein
MKHAAYSSTVKMEVTCPSETSVDFHRTTQRYIQEDRILHKHCFENVKSNSRYRVHSSPPLDPTRHTVTPRFLKIHRSAFLRISLPTGASVVEWSEFLATDPEVPGSTLGPTRFSEKWGSGTGSTQPREDN